jgi:biotin carboxyl carrier protein
MKEFKYKINGTEYKVTIGEIDENNVAHVEVNGASYNVEMEKKAAAPKVVAPKPVAAAAATPKAAATAAPKAAPAGKGSPVKTPLPGVILEIKVKEGQEIKKGQPVVVLEAMKMENNINADRDGVITAILVSKGDSILEGADVVMIG